MLWWDVSCLSYGFGFPRQKHMLPGHPIPLFSLKGPGECGEMAHWLSSLSGLCLQDVQALRKTSAAVETSGHLLSCARPPLCLPVTWMLARFFWKPKPARQLHHAEKCTGVVYVVVVCVRRWLLGRCIGSGFPDSNSSSTSYSSLSWWVTYSL